VTTLSAEAIQILDKQAELDNLNNIAACAIDLGNRYQTHLRLINHASKVFSKAHPER